jgi:hypothetical protein
MTNTVNRIRLVLQSQKSQMAAWGAGRSQNRSVWLRPNSPILTKSSRIRDRDYQFRISAPVVLDLSAPVVLEK